MNSYSSKIKTIYLTLSLGLLLALVGCVTRPPVQQGSIVSETYFFEAAGKDIEYQYYVPTSYSHHTPNALIILLHGLGSNPERVIRYEGLIDNAEKYGYVVAAPYGYNSGGWYGSRGQGNDFVRRRNEDTEAPPENLGELSEQDVLNVLAIMQKKLNIDEDRIYLMGHSMGGGGTFYLGMKYKDIWAGLAPMAPAIYSDPAEVKTIKDMPIVVVQGDEDRLVRVDVTRRWIDQMKQSGMTYKYIEIPGGDHVQSIVANPKMIGDVFQFLNAH